MDSDSDRLWLLILIAAFALLRIWFSACETALTEVNDAHVRSKSEEEPRYKKLERLLDEPTRLLRCFSVHRILSAVWIGVLTFLTFGAKLAAVLPTGFADLLSAVLLTAAAALFMTAVTDFLPRRIAAHSPEGLAVLCVPTVNLLCICVAPFVLVGTGLTRLLCLICRIPWSDAAEVVTEEEIRLLVDAGNETGGIEESQREMINNIFEFDDVTISEVMTHRKDMIAVPSTATASETAAIAMEEGFSRIPVYENLVDTIVGVVLVKDLLPLVGKAEDCPVTELMREALFVPETAKCRDVFQRMRRDKMQLAIVSDEYGGTAGMVTMEDLLEEIVGSIQDEYDDEEAEFTEISAGVYSIDGAADPEDVLPRLGIHSEENDEFDTMSAFVVHLLGRIPNEGERPTIEHSGVRYTLLSYEDNWISRIQAEVLPKEQETESDE